MYGAAVQSPLGGVGQALLVVVLLAGTALTVAYGLRFYWGAFASRRVAPLPPGHVAAGAHPVGRLILIAPGVLAALGLVGGLAAGWLDGLLAAYADTVAAVGGTLQLALWHGFTAALGLSVLGLALGAGAAWLLHRAGPPRPVLPEAVDAQWRYRRLMRGLDRFAVEVTGATQRGSLPFYLGTALVVLGLAVGWALLQGSWPSGWRLWDAPMQAWVGLLSVVVVVAATRVGQRLAAVLLVGASGYGMTVLFVLQGAPDLALTQALVETATLVVFVLVLRKLPKRIRERHTLSSRLRRLIIAVPVGVLVAIGGAVALAARRAPAVSLTFPEQALDFGGGRNVVNVILVDIRAWDTFGEVAVLIVAATGVASLVFLRRRTGAPPQLEVSSRRERLPEDRMFLRGGLKVPAETRSVVLEIATRILFHTMVVLSVYLLFAGHNTPGGGFAGGLVAGLALVLRYVAAGRYELGEAAPVDAGLVLGLGLLLAGLTGVAGLVAGGDVLQSAIWTVDLPLFGTVKLVTSLFFDIGVYLIVVGLILDILRSLGAELDRQDEDDSTPAEVSG
jgi:multicomponent Na+:H+ antiporter subunit A